MILLTLLLFTRSRQSCEETSTGANSVLDASALSLLTVRWLCAISVLIELTATIALKLVTLVCLWVALQQHASSMSFTNASQVPVTCNDALKGILKQVRLLCEGLKGAPLETDVRASAQTLSSLLSTSGRYTGAVKVPVGWVVVGDPITGAQINLLINVVHLFAEVVAAGVSPCSSRHLACCPLTYTVKHWAAYLTWWGLEEGACCLLRGLWWGLWGPRLSWCLRQWRWWW